MILQRKGVKGDGCNCFGGWEWAKDVPVRFDPTKMRHPNR
jgi:hypothetical protein